MTRPGRGSAFGSVGGFLVAVLLLPAGVAAQVGPDAGATDAPTRLTLEEAVRRAQANNPAHLRVENELELNDIEGREFWLGFLPQPQLSVLTTNMQWNRTTVAQDNFGNPIANPELRMIQSASSFQSAGLVFQLDAADFYRRQADRIRWESREVEVDHARSMLASDVRLEFLDAQETIEARALEERLLEVRQENRDLTERLFRLAQADRPDVLSAELDYVEQEDALERSRAARSAALLRLRNRIGDPSLGELDLEPMPLREFDPAVLDEEALVEAAARAGPRTRREEFGLEQAEREVSIERAGWFPTLALSASTGREQFSRESAGGFFQPIPDGEWGRRLSFTVAFPDLGQYFGRRTQARRTDVQIRNARATVREVRFEVEEEVRSLLVDLRNQHRTLELQERRTELATERLELEQERFRLGQIDYPALQNSAEAAANAQRQALEARYAFERALIRLERALGESLQIPDPAP